MKLYKHLLVALGVSLATVSCDDYLDVNDTPNSPTQNLVQPDLLLAGALEDPYRTPLSVQMNTTGNALVNHWAGDINNFAGGFQDEFTLNFTTTYQNGIWNELYRSCNTFQAIINDPTEDYDNHKAIAKVMKAYYFQYIVDLYGDVPYFEALQGGDNLTPVYDDAETIYRDLVVQCNEAIALINNSNSEDAVVGIEDIIFDGDMSQWIAFANTVKLKLYVRQMELAETNSETKSYLQSQFSDLDKNFIATDALINPGYTNVVGKQNPYYASYGFDVEGNPTSNYEFIVPSDYSAQFMKGQPTEDGVNTNIFDIRVQRYYRVLPSAGEVVGVVQGADNVSSPPALSELGPGLIISSSQDGYIMLAAESYLLQAEAVQRGYMSGNARDLFQQAIRESYRSLGLTLAQADEYITNSNSVNLIGYDGSSNKIEAIITQKWIALCGRFGMEAYIEYNRTGYPDIPLPIIAQEDRRPVRFLYPASEISTNAANVPTQAGTAVFNDPIFWDVN
ncbi:MAG: hypothetical protein CMF34_13735 [Leeuwenhoekiella sp.]|uniref:SusD/RagB family nutrient-binding outer membrane lipoprotein n=1 Tax=unclassified Leeuwenhoekiella TaxID=2615029 RepID=UPI000C47EFE7|nr:MULTISPECIES: SusD/RagB family nutrient-binding outer membrane lipoprotein [unclassified Leeuwenhoekiella]MAS21294.1 hypothetical protein [Leeuwenhoekiella sp.]MAW93934.1 hypothetical protein [Leeuwenhoekiella sp.]MBA81652.1 hypothetical protein [Leeuwenhoekiella sp.]|tara:strand:+ start:5270 stop:6787 length:1518 start_codon:yes stop_codon:yes gene_type:complete